VRFGVNSEWKNCTQTMFPGDAGSNPGPGENDTLNVVKFCIQIYNLFVGEYNTQ
jgi:hypothetical protein